MVSFSNWSETNFTSYSDHCAETSIGCVFWECLMLPWNIQKSWCEIRLDRHIFYTLISFQVLRSVYSYFMVLPEFIQWFQTHGWLMVVALYSPNTYLENKEEPYKQTLKKWCKLTLTEDGLVESKIRIWDRHTKVCHLLQIKKINW